MISNIWDEQFIKVDGLSEFHENLLKQYNIPSWANIKCPFCQNSLPLRSIRSISIKFNTRNIGDIVVEILCDKCSKMDSVYFRENIQNIDEFIGYLKGDKQPLSEPILEENMFKLRYNNVLEKMHCQRKKE